ncbi:MAG TPA: penicillin-binding protein, partial [Sumerlaeia bacterium]|nr:penicillin-binding protein [Sumerlaeia bacterium]
EVILSTMGSDVVLTINEAIQHYVEIALAEQVEAFEARGGVCVVLEVGTGAVLAMASNPTFDVNERGEAPAERLKNRCLVDAIPPGSVMKVFTSTALIERNKMSPYEEIDCHEGRFVFPMPGGRGYRVKDSHAMGRVPVLEAFTESSNVAFATLGRRLEKQELFDQWKAFRFGERTGIDLPEEERGMMRPLQKWDEYSRVSLPIGYEIGLTPIQVAAAMAAIANRGEYVRPHVLKEIRSPRNEVLRRVKPEVLGRVCSPQTAEIVLGMMERVVLEGTGQQAALPGYRIGGKTGTTVKTDTASSGEDSEEKRYYASFLAVLPVQAPRLVIYCWIDEPSIRWGSQVAAPLCQKVADHATRILGIRPSEVIPAVADAEEMDPGAFPDRIAGARNAELALPAPHGVEFTMPDVTGLTAREAAEKLHRLQIDARLAGWGVAIRQQPAPGDALTGSRALVIFGPPN